MVASMLISGFEFWFSRFVTNPDECTKDSDDM